MITPKPNGLLDVLQGRKAAHTDLLKTISDIIQRAGLLSVGSGGCGGGMSNSSSAVQHKSFML
jgi:hypothetical protein